MSVNIKGWFQPTPVSNSTLLPVVAFFSFVVLSPILFLSVQSFLDDSGGITLENFNEIVLSLRQLKLMRNSLYLSGLTVFFSLLIGIPPAVLICRTNLYCKKTLGLMLVLPLLIPPYVHAIIWTELSIPFVHTLWGGVFVFTLSFFPFVTLIALSGLKACNPSLEEAGLMGRGALPTLFRITLPLIGPHIFTGAILVFVFTIISFEVPDILRIHVYPMEVFIQFSAYYDEKAAAILSLPLILISMTLIGAQAVLMGKKKHANVGRFNDDKPVFFLKKSKALFFLLVVLLIVISGVIPLGTLFWKSGGPAAWVKAFNVSQDQIFYSIWVSLMSAAAMTVFSFVAAWYLQRNRGGVARGLDCLLQLPLGIPSISLGIGLIYVWNQKGLDVIYDSTGILVIAFVTAYSPFVIKIIQSSMQQIDREYEEVGTFGTGGFFRILLAVVLPLSMPGVLIGFFIGFILSLFNLGTALLVIPAGKSTLPVSIYNFLHYGSKEIVFAQSLILIFIALGMGFSVYGIYRFSRRSSAYD